MSNGLRIANEREIPRARLCMPDGSKSYPQAGALYIRARLKQGWKIMPDPSNRLQKEWLAYVVEGQDVKAEGIAEVRANGKASVPSLKRKGSPKGSKNKPKP